MVVGVNECSSEEPPFVHTPTAAVGTDAKPAVSGAVEPLAVTVGPEVAEALTQPKAGWEIQPGPAWVTVKLPVPPEAPNAAPAPLKTGAHIETRQTALLARPDTFVTTKV